MNNNLAFKLIKRKRINKKTTNKVTNTVTNKVTTRPITKHNNNMEWGTVTWNLFHWIAANIDEEFYKKSRSALQSIVLNIMYNLPCPTCKQHAIQFSKQYNIAKAKSKEQFIQYFYFFHNKVNERKNIVIPDRSILKNYTTMNGNDVITEWIKKFKNNLGINMNDFMNKQNIANAKESMIKFLKSNKRQFSNL